MNDVSLLVPRSRNPHRRRRPSSSESDPSARLRTAAPERCPLSSISEIPARAFGADDRGAIMVMGIFMCLVLVGALWYIAGVGDALVYRERMQEASDAAAFSTAAIEARGMNIIVMMNLLMAAALAIRVAINLIIYSLLIIGAILIAIGAALSLFGGEVIAALGEACVQVAEGPMQEVHNAVNQVLDPTLEALHTAELPGVQYATAAGAFLGAQEIASKYEPTVVNILPGIDALVAGNTVGTGSSPGNVGLPVTSGSTDKLCKKSFDAIEGAIASVSGKIGGDVFGAIAGFIKGIGVADVFCELGGTSNPDTSAGASDFAATQCKDNTNIQQTCQNAQTEQANVQSLENSLGYIDGAPDPDKPPPTQAQQDQVTAAQQQAQTDQDNCKKMQDSCKSGGDKGTNKPPPQVGGGGSGDGKEPAKVADNWHDGTDDAQIIAIVLSDGKSTTYSPKFVKIASNGKIQMDDPSLLKGQRNAWSQAEFFYDCPGDWSGKDCNADEEAMWNFHWRARFRLVDPNAIVGGTAVILGAEAPMALQIGADLAKTQLSLNGNGITPAKAQFGIDLTTLTPPLSFNLH